jgi:hypothetical protein
MEQIKSNVLLPTISNKIAQISKNIDDKIWENIFDKIKRIIKSDLDLDLLLKNDYD